MRVSGRAPGRARLEEVHGFAFGTEHQIVVVDQFGRGETIVKLHQVEVCGADARLLVGLLSGHTRERVHVGQDLTGFLIGIARQN